MQKLRDRPARRLSQLFIGLVFFGFAIALIIHANLGAVSWDVLTQGLSKQLPFSFGTITIIIGGFVLLLWIPLRQRPGIGTITNALLVGVFADIGLAVFSSLDSFWWQLVMLASGTLLLGVGSGLYIGAGLGPGPRDGLMTGIHARTGLPIWAARTGIEVSVLAIGWLLGGTVGIGTVAVTFLIGPLCQIFVPLFTLRAREASPEAAAPESLCDQEP
ncbi:MAG: YczE/YyaS/YitT family protein [Leucobacter sp.]